MRHNPAIISSSSSSLMSIAALELAAQVYRGRWFMIFASFMIMSAAGATYVFAVYSKDIKSTLGYDQQTLNTLGFFKDLGANFGLISGLINEAAPPWVVLSMGATMNFAGYFMIYLSITGRTPSPKFWQMCLYIAIGANSQGFANTGSLVTCVLNFPQSRGIVLGLLKGFVGLSGAIFTQLYHAFYGDDSKSLVLLIAWLPAAISIASVHSIRVIKPPHYCKINEFKVFCSFLYISIALALYLLVVIVIQKTSSFSRGGYIASAVVIVVVLLFLPLLVVFKEEFHLWKQKRKSIQYPPSVQTMEVDSRKSSTNPEPIATSPISCFTNIFKAPERGEDYSILQALVCIDMQMIFISTVCGTGGTLTAIDNMGQIGESLGYNRKSIGTFVSLISIWNYAGRVAAGFASEIFIQKYKCPRPLMLGAVLFLSCIGHILIAFPIPGSIYIATVVLGFTFGAQTPLFLAIISELFGLKHYSTLFNFGVLASPVGSYLFNVQVAGRLYDRETKKQNLGVVLEGSSKALTCMGVECYRLSFVIITVATFLAAIVMLVLTWRTKKFYGSDIYAKYRQEGEEDASVRNEGER